MCRIGGRLRSLCASIDGVIVEIPPFVYEVSNCIHESGCRTFPGGRFDWGGRLLNCNGGVQRFLQHGWKSCIECNSRRELNCETDKSSRYESRL